MNGERALIYSRIRENQLNPGENDLTRAARQQAVAQAAEAKLDLGRHVCSGSRSTAAS